MNPFLKKLNEIKLEIKLSSRKELLSFEDATIMLGVSESYLYKLTSQRRIPHFKPFGKLIFFKRSELMDWVEEGRILTREEILTEQVRKGSSPSYFKRKKVSVSETSESND